MSQPSDPTFVAPDSASGDSGAGGGGYGGPPPGGDGPAGSYGGPVGGPALHAGPAPVLVSFPPSAKQSRLTIAFRGLLAIPHLIILYALSIAAEVVAFIGWFAALFTGRLPEWAHTFITGTVRWQARVYAYVFFLTGAYPPFSFEDEPYPVRLVTARARLNRAAVFFRLILIFPASLVLGAATYGLAVLAFFFWLIALVVGRLPDSLHQAISAILRFQFRLYGYLYMLTGVYPWWGLFGDPVEVGAAESASAAEPDSAPAVATDPWRLPLYGAAEGLVALILGIGVLAWIAIGVLSAISAGNSASALQNDQGLVSIGAAYNQLRSTTTSFESAVQACGQLSCVTAQDQKEAAALQTFATAVSSAGVTGSAAADASAVVNDTNGAAQSLDKLATSTTVAQYQSEVASTGVQQQLSSLDTDYTKLINDLRA